jgi:hypothetical protein
MPILRECFRPAPRRETEPTKPALREVQVQLLAHPLFRTNAVAIAEQRHPHEQFGINRTLSGRAVWNEARRCRTSANSTSADPSSIQDSRPKRQNESAFMNQRSRSAGLFNAIRHFAERDGAESLHVVAQ